MCCCFCFALSWCWCLKCVFDVVFGVVFLDSSAVVDLESGWCYVLYFDCGLCVCLCAIG